MSLLNFLHAKRVTIINNFKKLTEFIERKVYLLLLFTDKIILSNNIIFTFIYSQNHDIFPFLSNEWNSQGKISFKLISKANWNSSKSSSFILNLVTSVSSLHLSLFLLPNYSVRYIIFSIFFNCYIDYNFLIKIIIRLFFFEIEKIIFP